MLMMAAAATGVALPALGDGPTYVTGVPGAPVMYLSSDAAQNPWLVGNPNFCPSAVFSATGGVSQVAVAGRSRIALAAAEGGFAIERAKPDYYLADQIVPPKGVDWPATYDAFLARPAEERAQFIFDEENHRVFAANGGTLAFTWVLSGGAERTMSYNVSSACSGRPRRIYWTDYPYNAPAIDLSGTFVRFFGPGKLVNPVMGVVTNNIGGMEQVISNKVVSGLHIDQSTHMLYASGQIQGQVVMAYYETGLFEKILHVQVVEVCRPAVNRMTGEIGRALKPDGRGYYVAGLKARPTYDDPSDNRGDYYYQHQGQQSYSPKHGEVYPLRPTVEAPWNMEVYWMETDEMLVEWPFELDQYACDWPADGTVFVRGDVDGDGGRPIYVPSDYTATLMKYQEPEGHARAVETDGTFNTVGEGWSLLQLTSNDNVWFVPVHSILRSNTAYFTLAPEEIRVGKELQLRGGSVAGVAEGFAPACDSESPGYIYAAASAPIWNPNLYKAPQPDNADTASATNATASLSGGSDSTNEYASVIYAISANPLATRCYPIATNLVEVWWNTTIKESDMPKALTIPTLPQVYSIRWPKDGEGAQIVIASQLGSSSESIFSHNAGIYLSETNATAALPERKYFDETDGGTLMFWAKAGSADAEGRAVLTIGNATTVVDAVDLPEGTVAIATADDWAAFATRVNSGETRLNARMVANVTLGDDAPRAGMTDVAAYSGNFNGGGHVLTVNWDIDSAVDTAPAAPFPYAQGCTITNLRIAGSIKGDSWTMGGLIGRVRWPGATITRCAVSATISNTGSGAAYIVGGFIGNTHWENMTVCFYDCLFDGSLLVESPEHCGGFLGWKFADPSVYFYSSLFNPAAVRSSSGTAYTFLDLYDSWYSLQRYYFDSSNPSYYTRAFGTEQGTSAAGMGAAELAAALGDKWTVSDGRPVIASIAGAPYSGETRLSVDLPQAGGQPSVSVVCCGDAISAPLPADDNWHHVAVSLSPTNLVLYVDGSPSATLAGFTLRGSLLEEAVRGRLGAAVVNDTDIPARSGTTLGEVLFWNRALSADEIAAEMYKVHNGSENHLTGCYTFIDGEDLNVTGTDRRTFTDKVMGTGCTSYKCLCDENGPPAKDTGVIDADGDTTPAIYAQNNPAATGYNPNEEHALLMPGSGGYVAWALRTDLNTESSSRPGVLVEYVKNGRKAMQWFNVAVTNSIYTELAADCVAGRAFPGPHPIDMMDDPWCAEDRWDEPVATAPAFRDRKGQLWARAAGTATMRMYYRMQDGFAFPSIQQSEWPAVGTAVPWLSLLGGDPTSSAALSARPAAWTWRVRWPDEVPEIEIGRTLTVAASGLPEVWNAGSVGVVWPATDAERDATAVLFDPTVAQTAGFSNSTFSTVAAAVTALGIKQGAGGNATLRKGRWYFDGLPPSLSSRFYLDTTANLDSCLKLEGEMENNPGGVSLLHVNVLNAEERAILRTLLDDKATTTDAKTAWHNAIDALATVPVRPSRHAAVSDAEDRVAYQPRDHYALFTMGATNYITLIENDAPEKVQVVSGGVTNYVATGVSEGDPVSMHLLKVVPKYYVGRVVTREDPLNLLSQQLSVIYAEAFAGRPGDYVFEWRKCRPHENGTVPEDFEGEYTLKFPVTAGLTRFVIGGQGDTLANMVNTYYAMRYRAASPSSPAYAAMGDSWSAWTTPPCLAEGWVQRVLNNVTPFAQRMRDFAENPTETAVSMLRQAGGPYEGDVALSQDNLTSVGLIQLYETILSKAESMSLLVGIDDADANKQLQLAVARLADLYSTLGDEAYTDALNPTIGFGGSFSTPSSEYSMDYGALSSSLFCFDNQVPTLLDEELALLRGRSGENAPSTRISPYYNRLPWNVTKSPVGGEVAYMVNYDISDTAGGDDGGGDGLIDEKDAAVFFPQGHGDAYGHYLSALSGYYRLLRNPYFTWGEPAMGEMVVADSVLNVDYYDEAKFAKASYDVAKTAALVVERTARKAYRDNGGAPGAGYLDDAPARAFGYGEWASRGGFGALANWAVANALLGEAPDSGKYSRYYFNGRDDSYIAAEIPEEVPGVLNAFTPWTVEFQVVPGQLGQDGTPIAVRDSSLLALSDESHGLSFVRDETGGAVSVVFDDVSPVTNVIHYAYWFYTNSVDSADADAKDAEYISASYGDCEYACFFLGSGPYPTAFPTDYDFADFTTAPPVFDGWGCMTSYEREYTDPDTGDEVIETESGLMESDYYEVVYEPSGNPLLSVEIGVAPDHENTLIALRNGGVAGAAGVLEAILFDASGAIFATTNFSLPSGFAIDLSSSASVVLGGNGYRGEIGEVRVWDSASRPNDLLCEKREFVSPLTDGLALYLRTIDDSPSATIMDLAEKSLFWTVSGGRWIEASESGMNLDFEDEGLLRIDRSTVPELSALADVIPDIQKKVDRMDAGLSPLGLADGAMAFDLTPINAGDGGKTHYEQIRERAGTALANARRSLDKAQEYGSRLHLLAEAEEGWETSTDTVELETKNKLIEYFGYPYEGDIGPSGTYPQGYDGPDVYNYAWMDLKDYGITSVKDTVAVSVTTKSKPALVNCLVPFWPSSSTKATDMWTFAKSATGFIVKPTNITGRRRAQGKIQDAMAEFLVAYANLESKISTMENRLADFEASVTRASIKAGITEAKAVFESVGAIMEYVTIGKTTALNVTLNCLELVGELADDARNDVSDAIPEIQGVGLTVNIDPRALANAVLGPMNTAEKSAIQNAALAAKNSLAIIEAGQSWTSIAKGVFAALGEVAEERNSAYSTLCDAWYELRSTNDEMMDAYRELQAKQAAVETIVAEADRVIDERTLARKQASGVLTKARYNEMFFRLARNNALSRYDAQFELAQKYCYLAAQAYDYETGLLSSDKASGDAFLARIVGARTLGEFDASGEPMAASDDAKGDGGLADILARMDENWLVLKPRLGINNPQPYATWFSLRHDLFRIYEGEKGDKAWRTELRKHMVDDLNQVAEFRHYCQPLAGSAAEKEPGLVIPFPSMIAAGVNFFGNDLVGGDAALDPTWFATHVSAAGVHFEGYDASALSRTPSAYLVPVGEDRMRCVGDPDTLLSWKVVDQTIPAPYAIGSMQLDDPDWTPLFDGATGGNDFGARIRKHPSFRAYYAPTGTEPSDDSLDCTRLVGRSAWNTRWLLIVPASSLSADRDAALAAFINAISDIKLGLKTYSTSGN